MSSIEAGTWNVANGVPAPVARAAVAEVWTAHRDLAVLALQEMRGRRLEPLVGVGCYHPNGSEGEDDNALMWSTSRFELLDAYALLLSDAGWRTVRGGTAPRRVAPVVLLRDVRDGGRHAFASVHLPPSLETPDGINREARTRLAVSGGSLRRLRNHVDGLCLLGLRRARGRRLERQRAHRRRRARRLARGCPRRRAHLGVADVRGGCRAPRRSATARG